MATEDGNRQDMAVADKEHPSLAATEEAQDVASLNRIVVGMPAFTDPHNPMTLSGSVNLSLDQHPVTHSEDYGQDVEPGIHTFDGPQSPMAVGAATLVDESGGGIDSLSLSEDREEWTKANWQAVAKHYGIATSGNTDKIRERVEDYEATEEAAEARGRELHGMSREDLDKLSADYDLDPVTFSRKEDLAEAILRAEREQD
jgi:hypothetical protein